MVEKIKVYQSKIKIFRCSLSKRVPMDATKSIATLVYLPDLAKPHWTNALAVGTK